jgi:hypothetical protein
MTTSGSWRSSRRDIVRPWSHKLFKSNLHIFLHESNDCKHKARVVANATLNASLVVHRHALPREALLLQPYEATKGYAAKCGAFTLTTNTPTQSHATRRRTEETGRFRSGKGAQ